MSHTRHRHEVWMTPSQRRRGQLSSALKARSCHGKVSHPSKRVANGVIRDMVNKGLTREGFILNAYKCKNCGRWHVGNSRGQAAW